MHGPHSTFFAFHSFLSENRRPPGFPIPTFVFTGHQKRKVFLIRRGRRSTANRRDPFRSRGKKKSTIHASLAPFHSVFIPGRIPLGKCRVSVVITKWANCSRDTDSELRSIGNQMRNGTLNQRARNTCSQLLTISVFPSLPSWPLRRYYCAPNVPISPLLLVQNEMCCS